MAVQNDQVVFRYRSFEVRHLARKLGRHLLKILYERFLAVANMRVVLDVVIAHELFNGLAGLALIKHQVIERFRIGCILLQFGHDGFSVLRRTFAPDCGLRKIVAYSNTSRPYSAEADICYARFANNHKEYNMKRLLKIISLLAATSVILAVPQTAFAEHHESILVTGASTGIGRHLAETLASNGYHVYAGARKDKDLAGLNAIENVTAVRLDVTDQDQIDAAVAMIIENGTGLYGLVNNAGVSSGDFIVETPIEDQTFVYAVNVEGVYRITKAFAPLVIESKGRIVTTGSIAGTLSWPGGSAYSGSKHWIEALTDSLADEMEPLGVSVSVVEPGNYKSNIRRSSVSRGLDKLAESGGEVTEEMKKDYEATAERELSYKEPDEVSEAFMHALFDESPLRRYMVVPNAEEQGWTIGAKIVELVQLNQWGPYSYSRDELVALLDEAMSGDKPND